MQQTVRTNSSPLWTHASFDGSPGPPEKSRHILLGNTVFAVTHFPPFVTQGSRQEWNRPPDPSGSQVVGFGHGRPWMALHSSPGSSGTVSGTQQTLVESSHVSFDISRAPPGKPKQVL